MIWISTKATPNGAIAETSLTLAPMDVDYPDRRDMTVRTSQDGAVVIQRPLRDSRPRRWIWRGYGLNDPTFAAQWAFLESLDYQTRTASGLVATVGIWEDFSGVGGFNKLSGSSRVYTTVRVIQVDRTPRKGGGPISYESVVEFYVEDPAYAAF
jgi:hypothetical protein